MKVLVVYYSVYGHIHRMAEAVAEGAKEVKGVEVEMRRVPETLPEEILKEIGALEAQKTFAHVPILRWMSWVPQMRSSLARPHASEICADRCASSLMLLARFG